MVHRLACAEEMDISVLLDWSPCACATKWCGELRYLSMVLNRDSYVLLQKRNGGYIRGLGAIHNITSNNT